MKTGSRAMIDRIHFIMQASPPLESAIFAHHEYIKRETLALSLDFVPIHILTSDPSVMSFMTEDMLNSAELPLKFDIDGEPVGV